MDFLFAFAFVVATAMFAHPARAVPPPDFIISLGTTLTQFFTLAFLFAATIASTSYRLLRLHLATKTGRMIAIAGLIVLTTVISIGDTMLYRQFATRQAKEQVEALQQKFVDEQKAASSLDTEATSTAATPDIRIPPDDAVSGFIRTYYANIGSGHLREAYDVSQKYVPFATFSSWYAHTDQVTIDRLVRIDATHSSLELTLLEQGTSTRYAVLMEVTSTRDGLRIAHSDVRVLGEEHETSMDPLAITNIEFQALIDQKTKPYLVLDARENIENEYGHFPESEHIRFADLKAGRWIELPTDRDIVVLCWSGIRGKEVTQFLRSKGLQAHYLENGSNGWVDFGGSWVGEIKFHDLYTEDQYHLLFTTPQVRDAVQNGAFLVDTRSPDAFTKAHITGSVNIPLMSTPSVGIEAAMSQVPSGANVITVCDGYVNCFDAQLTGVELERRGHRFLGRYATPSELY